MTVSRVATGTILAVLLVAAAPAASARVTEFDLPGAPTSGASWEFILAFGETVRGYASGDRYAGFTVVDTTDALG